MEAVWGHGKNTEYFQADPGLNLTLTPTRFLQRITYLTSFFDSLISKMGMLVPFKLDSSENFMPNYVKDRCFPGGASGKDATFHCRRLGFDPWVGKVPWRRDWQTSPVFLPGEFHGQTSLVGYNPWAHKDTTEAT